MKVRDILATKGGAIHTVSPADNVFYALQKMADYDIGSLIVMENNMPIGIFSERDYARKVILKGKFSKDVPVLDVMHQPAFVTDDDDVRQCMRLMTDKFIRHLVVIRDGDVAGIISIGDVVKAVISDQEFVIENLSNYIAGSK